MDPLILACCVGWYALAYWVIRKVIRRNDPNELLQHRGVALLCWVFSPLPPICILVLLVWAGPACKTFVAALTSAGELLFPRGKP
jgi:hypothetical protein